MKIEIEKDFPQYFKPAYPEEFELFSHFEVTAGIPTVLFAITTWKENGKPNVCFHSWSCFHGDKTAFFAVMGNLYQHTHTYANIQREKCFCINFLPISCYDRLVNTIHKNERDDDEFAAGGFTVSNAKTIHAPTISEAFLTMECTLKEIQDLSGAGITAMVIGQVQHISVEEAYAQGYELRYGKDGFMLLVPAPQDLVTGEPNPSAIATVHIEKYDCCKERAKMAVSNIKALIPGELQKVWELVLDIENYGAWRSDLSKAEVISDKKFIEYTKEGYPTTFTVTLATPYRRWEFDMENSNMTGHWTGIFTAKGDETEIDFTEQVEAKKWLLKPFVKSYLRKQQTQFVADIMKNFS